ncbi:uncharacterized protein LAJ45_10629 [Morchella importuna]|uniref:uncharacterized protein n=1 Tax=Morchella importuna TaxID=1174673 RepID=UPI001E8D5960|nr:uncharacterized protein LAJ45_10629 [Morchella importuna]KAH8145347.1 hypothetical protein LAJ45_10629 [Morchella importuna]
MTRPTQAFSTSSASYASRIETPLKANAAPTSATCRGRVAFEIHIKAFKAMSESALSFILFKDRFSSRHSSKAPKNNHTRENSCITATRAFTSSGIFGLLKREIYRSHKLALTVR